MGEPNIESKPYYECELEIYENETLKKIEDFRSARSSWITNNGSTKKYSTVKEGLKQTNIYCGRFKFLTKHLMSMKSLHIHFKTLRPLRFYTLKQQAKHKEETQKPVQRKEEYSCSDIELWSEDEPPRKGKMKPIQKRKLKKKKAKCTEMKMPAPCREALKKLKAAKLEQNMIESCRCDDGREVTVVIKGICLCDKISLNNLKLDKVCDKYSRKVASSDKEANEAHEKDLAVPNKDLTKTQTHLRHKKISKIQVSAVTEVQKISQDSSESDELLALHTVSSSVIHKKRMKSLTAEGETSGAKSRKVVGFDKEEYDKPEQKRKIMDSDLTIYPRVSNESVDLESTPKKHELNEANEKIKETTSELHVESSMESYKKFSRSYTRETDIEKPVSLLKIEPEESKLKQNVSNATEIERDHDGVDSISQDTKTKEETSTEDLREESLKTEGIKTTQANDESPSMITIYRNMPQKESEFGLTQEQMEVLKQNENNQN